MISWHLSDIDQHVISFWDCYLVPSTSMHSICVSLWYVGLTLTFALLTLPVADTWHIVEYCGPQSWCILALSFMRPGDLGFWSFDRKITKQLSVSFHYWVMYPDLNRQTDGMQYIIWLIDVFFTVELQNWTINWTDYVMSPWSAVGVGGALEILFVLYCIVLYCIVLYYSVCFNSVIV